MKKFLFVSLVVFTLAACDKTVKDLYDDNAIEISASIVNNTRVSYDIRNLQSFHLLGIHNDKELLMNKVVSRDVEEGTVVWRYAPVTYWPREGYTDFFAVGLPLDHIKEHARYEMSIDEEGKARLNYSAVDTDGDNVVKGLFDVVYARNQKVALQKTPVQMSFRHATAQIVFQFRNINPVLKVYIEDMRIANIYGSGTYTLPDDTTTKDKDSACGKWTLNTDKGNLVTYDVDINASADNWLEVPCNGKTIRYPEVMASREIMAGNNVIVEDSYVNILPQAVNAWDYRSDPKNELNGSYFLLKVKIMVGDVCIWPRLAEGEKGADAGTDWVAVPCKHPVVNSWEEGKRYVYTMVFDQHTGVTLPSDSNPGEDILVPIGKIEKEVKVELIQ